MNKRKLPACYRTNKRVCATGIKPKDSWVEDDGASVIEESTLVCSDVKAALLYLKNLFPVFKLEGRLPPIIFHHQLYSVLSNRTFVDKEVGELREKGEIRLFRLGSEANEMCIVFTEDYKNHVIKFCRDLDVNIKLIEKFLSEVIDRCSDVSLSKERMTELHFSDSDITYVNRFHTSCIYIQQLIKACLLTVRDVGSWWLAIPSAGLFMKTFLNGRRAILAMIKKSKYSEILQKDLELRKLPKQAKLGITYHIHDVIGADLIESVLMQSTCT